MKTIRETLLSVKGENETSIQPILKALSALGFHEHDQAGKAFSLLKAERAAGLNVRQQLALTAAIQAVAASLGDAGSATTAGGVGGGGTAALEKGASGGQGLLPLAVGGPLLLLVLVVDRGVGRLSEAVECVKAFIAHNDPQLAVTYKTIRGLGFVGSIGMGAAAAVGVCLKRLNVRPGRPRVLRPVHPKLDTTGSGQGPEQHSSLAPASPAMSDSGA
ncbi:hypothetical protein CHLRE_05g243650v5 [Chlamydomonas reinhardtii]|uniref:Uncharacterized protein n=1 Tax=Chlamydomonas reinhardtii TaxID=3055 RepID=A0A2K3DSA9_CHLRE|nr:uncharacterized protein CHLRE_05g243650v5 [Chlamydomonas reinhardtii]PNW83426.1 hypothetical protein CHLRE_05g243650v5 [Chlamydomonas reinhardtii]